MFEVQKLKFLLISAKNGHFVKWPFFAPSAKNTRRSRKFAKITSKPGRLGHFWPILAKKALIWDCFQNKSPQLVKNQAISGALHPKLGGFGSKKPNMGCFGVPAGGTFVLKMAKMAIFKTKVPRRACRADTPILGQKHLTRAQFYLGILPRVFGDPQVPTYGVLFGVEKTQIWGSKRPKFGFLPGFARFRQTRTRFSRTLRDSSGFFGP